MENCWQQCSSQTKNVLVFRNVTDENHQYSIAYMYVCLTELQQISNSLLSGGQGYCDDVGRNSDIQGRNRPCLWRHWRGDRGLWRCKYMSCSLWYILSLCLLLYYLLSCCWMKGKYKYVFTEELGHIFQAIVSHRHLIFPSRQYCSQPTRAS